MRKIIFLIATFLSVLEAKSQNDLCENANTLIPNLNCEVIQSTFNGATISTTAPSCGSSASQDVWFQFVATEKVNSILLTATSGLNHGFQVLEGNCDGTSILCVNSSSFNTAEFNTNGNYTVGQTYFIRVFNASSTISSSNFGICLQKYPSPSNDLCSGAIALTPSSTCVSTLGSFSGSSSSNAAPSCANNASQDVWYSFVATDPTMSVAVDPSNSNVGFEVLVGSCTGTSMACVNNNGLNVSEFYLNNNFTVGQTYFVRVVNTLSGLSQSNFSICVQNYPTPSNDLCSGAIVLTPTTNCVTVNGSFVGSSISGTLPSCGPNSTQDIWYQFTSQSNAMNVFVGSSVGLNHGFELYEGSCSGSLVPSCMNLFGQGVSEQANYTALTPNQTYFLRIFNTAGLSQGTVQVCVYHPSLDLSDRVIENMRIFPNPVTDFMNVYGVEQLDNFYFEIVNQLGQGLMHGQLNESKINVERLTPGIYFLTLTSENTNSTQIIKFLKQ